MSAGGRTPSATVVVPTRDRPERLAACLAALERQTLRGLEIVVVDDGSRRPAQVSAALAACPSARLVRLEGRGPSAARNAGARAARAPTVLFCDDDCEPVPGWATHLAGAVAAGAPAAAGRTLNGVAGSALATASHAVLEGVIDAGRDDRSGALTFAPTCNLAAGAGLLAAIPFDESYPLAAGEDRDWGARLAARGLTMTWVPAAVVVHRHHLSAAGFWLQHHRYGRGAARFRAGQGARARTPGLRRAVLRRGLAAGARVSALVAVAQVATATGLAREALAHRLDGARGNARRGRPRRRRWPAPLPSALCRLFPRARRGGSFVQGHERGL